MNPESFLEILETLISEAHYGSTENKKSLFKVLWKECSAEFKKFIFHDEERPLKMFVTFDFHWINGVDITDVIFKDLNTQQKRNTILSQDILLRCSYLIRKDKWDSINSFINCTSFSDEDINQMKRYSYKDMEEDKLYPF